MKRKEKLKNCKKEKLHFADAGSQKNEKKKMVDKQIKENCEF